MLTKFLQLTISYPISPQKQSSSSRKLDNLFTAPVSNNKTIKPSPQFLVLCPTQPLCLKLCTANDGSYPKLLFYPIRSRIIPKELFCMVLSLFYYRNDCSRIIACIYKRKTRKKFVNTYLKHFNLNRFPILP